MNVKVDVVWPEPKPLDHFMLMDIFAGVDFNPVGVFEYNIVDDFSAANGDGVVFVANGTNTEVIKLNETLSTYKWVLLIVVSDENNLFEIDKVEHQNIKIWIQTPRADKEYNDVRYFGVGYGFASKFRSDLYDKYHKKSNDVFISGQNTHERRRFIFEELHDYADSNPERSVDVFETEGFTQGMEPLSYYSHMAGTRIAPCPSGVVSPDSFRLYEALELGAIPIADDISPAVGYNSRGYWNRIFPDAPFPTIKTYDNLIDECIDECLDNYQYKANNIFAWWIGQKRKYYYELVDDISQLSGASSIGESAKDKITVIVPVSPWRSHPSTEVLDDCLASIRAQLPDSEIIVTFDGVREEQSEKTSSYEEFIKRALWKINTQHKNVLPLLFNKHTHQSGMMKEALKHVKTDYVLYVEGDMSFYDDRIAPWDDFLDLLDHGDANIIRIHFEASIPEPHEYLMYHEHDLSLNDNTYVATSQWSQRPHLMRTSMYSEVMNNHFSSEAACFIEDRFYYIINGECSDGFWKKWKMFIFLPGTGLSMAYHLDGRDGEKKYDANQIW